MKCLKEHPSENNFFINSVESWSKIYAEKNVFSIIFTINAWKLLLMTDFLLMKRASLTLSRAMGPPHWTNG